MTDFRCTYRLQLSEDFDFRAAREVAVPYVVDPTRISESLGGETEFRSLCAAAREAGLGVLFDIVPNHMATSEEENPFWRDCELRAKFFDWDPESGWYRRSSTSASSPACASRTRRCSRRRTG